MSSKAVVAERSMSNSFVNGGLWHYPHVENPAGGCRQDVFGPLVGFSGRRRIAAALPAQGVFTRGVHAAAFVTDACGRRCRLARGRESASEPTVDRHGVWRDDFRDSDKHPFARTIRDTLSSPGRSR